jgi:hypothetical protein
VNPAPRRERVPAGIADLEVLGLVLAADEAPGGDRLLRMVRESTTVATASPFTNLICVRSTITPSTPGRSTRTSPALSVSEGLVYVVYGIGTRTSRVRNAIAS